FPIFLAVKGDSPFSSVSDLVAYARNPGNKVPYGYAQGTGEIAGAAFVRLANLQATGVAYKGWPQAWLDLAAGEYNFAIGDLVSSAPFVKTGRVKFLAVSSGKESKLAPELPPIAKAANLPDYDVVTWMGFAGPAGIPKDIVEKLSGALNAMLARPAVVQALKELGVEAAPNTPAEFASWIQAQVEVWRVATQLAGIEPR
ncbi:MAG: Bug family tripartite tricarboxylate transporter substrate binding protein, partial [Lautropia sp.]